MSTLMLSGGFGQRTVSDAFSYSQHPFSLVCHSSTQSDFLYDVLKESCFSVLFSCPIYLGGSYHDYLHVDGMHTD